MRVCHSGTASGCRSSVEATYGQKVPVVACKRAATPFSVSTESVLWSSSAYFLCLAVMKA